MVCMMLIGHITSIKPEDDPQMEAAKAIAKRGALIGFDTVGHLGLTSLVTEAQKVKMTVDNPRRFSRLRAEGVTRPLIAAHTASRFMG